jgi:hypothetical protein
MTILICHSARERRIQQEVGRRARHWIFRCAANDLRFVILNAVKNPTAAPAAGRASGSFAALRMTGGGKFIGAFQTSPHRGMLWVSE